MPVTETDICNLALGKIGGAGDVAGGNAFISSINGNDKVSTWCKLNFPRVRARNIRELAVRKSPYRHTIRFADLGSELESDSLPEIGQYTYAFNLPGDCLHVVRQFYEASMQNRGARGNAVYEVQWEIIANSAGSGKVLLTDYLTNLAGTSAFIEYVVDATNTAAFTEEQIDCIATLLASEICPVVGADTKVAQAMLLRYESYALPNAQASNNTDYNLTVKRVPDFSGGRSGGFSYPAANAGLGTYVDGEGNRRDIDA